MRPGRSPLELSAQHLCGQQGSPLSQQRERNIYNVSKSAGICGLDGENLSVQVADYDNDGWPDLLVANDGLAAYLYHNGGNGKLQETAISAGMAYTTAGDTMAAMCISLADYDNDVLLDFHISDFQKSSNHLWHNAGGGFMDEVSKEAPFIGNGHGYPEIAIETRWEHASGLRRERSARCVNLRRRKLSVAE